MSNKLKILVVEDEEAISNFIATTLKANDYNVIMARTGKEALSMIPSHCPDVILLDLGLPDIDGIDILQQIREWSNIPVIVVSARTEEADKVKALDMGADDYIAKPFGTSELLARIRTALRHYQYASDLKGSAAIPIYHYDGLTIDFEKRLVTLNGQTIHLTQIEYKLVTLLAQNSGKVLTYDYIISHIWGPYADNNNQILRVNMAHIRRKLEVNPAEPKYIFTEIGVGYRMQESQS